MENFPLKGEYLFRAKYRHGKEVLWYDIDKNSPKLPTDEGVIFLKVKRVSWNSASPHYAQADNKAFIFEGELPAKSTPKAATPGPTVPTHSQAKVSPNKKSEIDMLGIDIDLMETHVPIVKKTEKAKSANIMEDFLL